MTTITTSDFDMHLTGGDVGVRLSRFSAQSPGTGQPAHLFGEGPGGATLTVEGLPHDAAARMAEAHETARAMADWAEPAGLSGYRRSSHLSAAGGHSWSLWEEALGDWRAERTTGQTAQAATEAKLIEAIAAAEDEIDAAPTDKALTAREAA